MSIENDVEKFMWFNSGMGREMVRDLHAKKIKEWDPDNNKYLLTSIENIKQFLIRWKAYFDVYNSILDITDETGVNLGDFDGYLKDMDKMKNKIADIKDPKDALNVVAQITLLKSGFVDRLMSSEFCKVKARIQKAEKEQNSKFKPDTFVNNCLGTLNKSSFEKITIDGLPPTIDLRGDYNKSIKGAGDVPLKDLMNVADEIVINSSDYRTIDKLTEKVSNVKNRLKEIKNKLLDKIRREKVEKEREKTKKYARPVAVVLMVVIIIAMVALILYFTISKGSKLFSQKSGGKHGHIKGVQG